MGILVWDLDRASAPLGLYALHAPPCSASTPT